ncbi:MAG: hypothetical protein LDLANPLL_00195 [Turneriella sp.]|nr:hypothetical protein [Turneriella sp.]
MEIYEPATQQQLYFWQTGVVKPPQKPPVSLYIENGEFWQRPGSAKIFVLTMKNDTTKPVHFFAAPHHVTPPEYSLGFHFNCLCVNHVFTVNPGETWYRVVRLLLHKEHRGDKLTIRHVLIAAGDEQMKAFSDNPTLHKHIEANEKKHTEQGEN